MIIESKAMALRGTGKAGFVLLSVILLIAGSSNCQSAGHARSKFWFYAQCHINSIINFSLCCDIMRSYIK